MKLPGDHKLDNPVWHSLQETHRGFSLNFGGLACYQPGLCPFGGFVNDENIAEGLDAYAAITNNFFVVGNKPTYSPLLQLVNELVCLQMVLDKPIEMPIEEEIVYLKGRYEKELFQLVTLVQPGYFRPDTSQLGSYFGILKSDQLVAVAGERMKMNDHTEVSAIVTHPDHGGKGYARQLTAFTVNKIFGENRIPYLHVAAANTGAIRLYEKLGFRTRRKISFWQFQAGK